MNEINKIDSQIESLLVQKKSIQESIFEKASQNWLSLLNTQYESSSSRTPEYLTFCRIFKKQFTKLLRDNFEVHRIQIDKPNHFDTGGFIELSNGKMFNFFIGDLRWNKSFCIRSVTSFTDYNGGSNQYCNIDDIDHFMRDLKSCINGNW